ncbi:MAG TPA: hypothetical protein VNA21_07395 [Steroidobacteraceae bacterium]|nr:hypothetical protein [Steroidobacteraceae bacterium]
MAKNVFYRERVPNVLPKMWRFLTGLGTSRSAQQIGENGCAGLVLWSGLELNANNIGMQGFPD